MFEKFEESNASWLCFNKEFKVMFKCKRKDSLKTKSKHHNFDLFPLLLCHCFVPGAPHFFMWPSKLFSYLSRVCPVQFSSSVCPLRVWASQLCSTSFRPPEGLPSSSALHNSTSLRGKNDWRVTDGRGLASREALTVPNTLLFHLPDELWIHAALLSLCRKHKVLRPYIIISFFFLPDMF